MKYLIDNETEQIVLPAVEAAQPAEIEHQDVVAEERGQRDLKAIAQSVPHMLTHFPKNRWCDACRRAKLIRKACPARDAELPPEEVFGDYLTVDHMIFNGFLQDAKVKLQQLSFSIV